MTSALRLLLVYLLICGITLLTVILSVKAALDARAESEHNRAYVFSLNAVQNIRHGAEFSFLSTVGFLHGLVLSTSPLQVYNNSAENFQQRVSIANNLFPSTAVFEVAEAHIRRTTMNVSGGAVLPSGTIDNNSQLIFPNKSVGSHDFLWGPMQSINFWNSIGTGNLSSRIFLLDSATEQTHSGVTLPLYTSTRNLDYNYTWNETPPDSYPQYWGSVEAMAKTTEILERLRVFEEIGGAGYYYSLFFVDSNNVTVFLGNNTETFPHEYLISAKINWKLSSKPPWTLLLVPKERSFRFENPSILLACILGSLAISFFLTLTPVFIYGNLCVEEKIPTESFIQHAPSEAPFAIVVATIDKIERLWTSSPNVAAEVFRSTLTLCENVAYKNRAYQAQTISNGAVIVCQNVEDTIRLARELHNEMEAKTWDQQVLFVFENNSSPTDLGSGTIESERETDDDEVHALRLKVAIHWTVDCNIELNVRANRCIFEGEDLAHTVAVCNLTPPGKIFVTHAFESMAEQVFEEDEFEEVPPLRSLNGEIITCLLLRRNSRGQSAAQEIEGLLPKLSSQFAASTTARNSTNHTDITQAFGAFANSACVEPDTPIVACQNPLTAPEINRQEDIINFERNVPATWMYHRGCDSRTCKKLLEILEEQLACHRERQMSLSALLSTSTYFVQAYAIIFFVFDNSEREVFYRKLQKLFGIPSHDILLRLAVRCAIIINQRLVIDDTERRRPSDSARKRSPQASINTPTTDRRSVPTGSISGHNRSLQVSFPREASGRRSPQASGRRSPQPSASQTRSAQASGRTSPHVKGTANSRHGQSGIVEVY